MGLKLGTILVWGLFYYCRFFQYGEKSMHLEDSLVQHLNF